MARPDFRSQAAERLASERSEYTPALIDLLKPDDPATVRDVRVMPTDRVYSNPAQPRQHFDEEALQDLASSIREHGVLQPVLLRPYPGKPAQYQIVAGERRWRAAQAAQLHEVPVIIRELNDESVLEIALVENIQRADLNPLHKPLLFKHL